VSQDDHGRQDGSRRPDSLVLMNGAKLELSCVAINTLLATLR